MPFPTPCTVLFGLALVVALPALAAAAGNPQCPGEDVLYNPSHGEDIVVPSGYKVSVFAKDLNFPTAVAFVGNAKRFTVYVLESGHGLPSRCNDETTWPGGTFAANNPFTPDILVFDQSGNKISAPLAKPTPSGGGLAPRRPAVRKRCGKGAPRWRAFVPASNPEPPRDRDDNTG